MSDIPKDREFRKHLEDFKNSNTTGIKNSPPPTFENQINKIEIGYQPMPTNQTPFVQMMREQGLNDQEILVALKALDKTVATITWVIEEPK